MASHPLEYSSAPSINPSGAPSGDQQRIATNADMFGGAVAGGLEKLGSGLEKAGNTEVDLASQQAQIDNQTHAAEVHSWQSNQTTDAQEKFLSLKGKAALDALSDYKKQIDDIHQQAREQAGSPYAARLIDEQGRRLVDSSYSGAARYASTERKSWEQKTAIDSAQSYGNRAVLQATQSPAENVNDDLTVQHGLANSDNEVRNLFHGQGYEDNAIEAEVQKNRGRNVKAIVEQIASDASGDSASPASVKRAFDFYKSQEDKIDAGSRVNIQNYLRGPLNQIAGGKIADEAMGRPPAPPKPEVVADVPSGFIGAIKNTEGYRAKAYWDVNHYSIGYGTRANSPDEVIDQAEATRRFNSKIDSAAKFVDSVNPNLDPGTRAALISLTHNAGEGWGTSGLGDKIRAGDVQGAKENFLQYNKAGGETNEGLVMRRAREAAWFGRGDISATEASQPHANKGDVMLRILDDPNLQNRPQVQAAALARVNKIYQAWELQSATDKASFQVTVKNSTAEALSTGKVAAPLSQEQFISNYGVAEGPKQWQDYQANVQLGSDIRSTATLSPQDLAALRESYTPKPGETFVAQQHRASVLDKAIASNEKAKQDDPADYLIRRTDFGGEAYKAFQTQMADKNATPDMKTAYAGMFAEKMSAEQLRLGVAADKVQIVPQAYIDQLNTKLNNPALNGGSLGVVQGIEAESKLWGSHWPEVYRQLGDKAQPVVRVIGSGVKPDAAQALADLMPFTLPEILKDQDTEKSAGIKKDVLDAFKPLAGSMGGQDGAIGVFNDFRGQAEKLAAKYVVGGMTSRDAAAKAYDDLVGFKYTFQEGYRIPKDPSIDPTQVLAGANEIKQSLGKDDRFKVMPLRDTMGGLTPEYLARETAAAYARDGKWVTSPDEKGLALVYNDRAVRMANGAPLIVPWSELTTRGERVLKGAAPSLGVQP